MTGSNVQGTPVLVRDGTNIDRRQCRRVVPMKVLVLGLCRTGTMCESLIETDAYNTLFTAGRLTQSDFSRTDGPEVPGVSGDIPHACS